MAPTMTAAKVDRELCKRLIKYARRFMPADISKENLTALAAQLEVLLAENARLMEVAEAALAWQKAVRERCDYGTATYASNPFDIMTEDFRDKSESLDVAADGLLREFLAALSKVAP